MRIIFSILQFLFLGVAILNAQHFTGVNSSAFAGLYSINQNPANIVAGKYKLEIQFVSSSLALNSQQYLSLQEDSDIFDTSNNLPLSGNINALVRGMSFAFQFGKQKHAVSLTVDGRANVEANNFNPQLANLILDNFNDEELIGSELGNSNLRFLSNAWTETSLSYGLIVFDKTYHQVKASARVKFLHSINSAYINSDNLNVRLEESQLIDIANSNIDFTFSGNNMFDPENFDLAYDFGIIYNWRPNKHYADANAKYNYKLSVGLALLDYGELNSPGEDLFSGGITTIQNPQFAINEIDDDVSVVRALLTSSSDIVNNNQARTYSLPTRFTLQADYQIYKGIFLHALYDSGNNKEDSLQIRSPSFLQITPRVEKQKIGVYFPITFESELNFGFATRLGPFSFGVRDVPSLVKNIESTKGNQVFVGLRLAIKKSTEESKKKKIKKESKKDKKRNK